MVFSLDLDSVSLSFGLILDLALTRFGLRGLHLIVTGPGLGIH